MSSYTAQTENTPPITTPGHLLANIPGLLGFYPTESVIFMAIDTTPRGPAMGPVARVDIEDAEETLPEIAAMLAEEAREGIFAFLVSHRPVSDLSQVACWLYTLDRGRDGIDIDAAWYVGEIARDEPYTLLHGAVSIDGRGPMKNWVEGTIPALTDAPTMRSCVDHDVVPELSREEFFATFARNNQHCDALETEALGREARESATRFRARVASEKGDKRKELVDNFIDDVRWALSTAGSIEDSETNTELLKTCAVWMSTTWTRDLVIASCTDAGEQAAQLLLATARTYDGEIRANALTVFALTHLKMEWDILAGPALQTVAEEFPSHRLGSLLCQAYRHGLHDKMRETIGRGAREAYNSAIGREEESATVSGVPRTTASSDAPSEPARRVAG